MKRWKQKQWLAFVPTAAINAYINIIHGMSQQQQQQQTIVFKNQPKTHQIKNRSEQISTIFVQATAFLCQIQLTCAWNIQIHSHQRHEQIETSFDVVFRSRWSGINRKQRAMRKSKSTKKNHTNQTHNHTHMLDVDLQEGWRLQNKNKTNKKKPKSSSIKIQNGNSTLNRPISSSQRFFGTLA